MTEGAALYRAICANPYDDTPRLVFADWLDENGGPEHAAFIRAQVEQARWPEGTRFLPVEGREEALPFSLDELIKRDAPPKGPTLKNCSPLWHRGFVDEIDVDAKTLLGKGMERLKASYPITKVNVSGITPKNAGRVMERLKELDIRGLGVRELPRHVSYGQDAEGSLAIVPDPEGDARCQEERCQIIDRLLGTENASHLERLDLRDSLPGDYLDAVQHFADACRFLPNLRVLDLSHNNLSGDDYHGVPEEEMIPPNATALKQAAQHLKQLKSLKLENNGINNPLRVDRWLDAVGEFKNLEYLGLGRNNLNSEHQASLTALGDGLAKLPNLKSLDLHSTDIRSPNMLAAALENAPGLEGLNLYTNRYAVGPERLLTQWPPRSGADGFSLPAGLRVLDLTGSGLRPADNPERVAALFAPLTQLEVLKMENVPYLRDRQLEALESAMKALPQLKELSLHNCSYDPAKNTGSGAAMAKAVAPLTQLRVLNIGNCAFQDEEGKLQETLAAKTSLELLDMRGQMHDGSLVQQWLEAIPRFSEGEVKVLDEGRTQQLWFKRQNAPETKVIPRDVLERPKPDVPGEGTGRGSGG